MQVWDGAVDVHGPGEVLTTVAVPLDVGADERASGVWTLVVNGPSSAIVLRWSLTVGSDDA